MKTTLHGLGKKMPGTNIQGIEGRPSKKSIVRHKAPQPSQLGRSTWLTKRVGKVSIKGGQN